MCVGVLMFVCVYGYPQGPPPGGEGPLAFPRPGANGDYAAGIQKKISKIY